MIKRTQIIRLQQPVQPLSVFDHFMGLGLKWSKLNGNNDPVKILRFLKSKWCGF